MDILIVVASHNKNLELAQKIYEEVGKQGLAGEIIDLTEVDLPLYTSRLKDDQANELAVSYQKRIASAKSLVVVAPEYNGSIPPTLSNFIAWISVCTKDWREAFNGKPAVIATHSGGGGVHGLMAMRQQLSYVGMNVLGRQLQTNYQKALNEESLEAVIAEVKKYI